MYAPHDDAVEATCGGGGGGIGMVFGDRPDEAVARRDGTRFPASIHSACALRHARQPPTRHRKPAPEFGAQVAGRIRGPREPGVRRGRAGAIYRRGRWPRASLRWAGARVDHVCLHLHKQVPLVELVHRNDGHLRMNGVAGFLDEYAAHFAAEIRSWQKECICIRCENSKN